MGGPSCPRIPAAPLSREPQEPQQKIAIRAEAQNSAPTETHINPSEPIWNPPNPNTGSSTLNGRFLQSSTLEVAFSLELWTESIGLGTRKLFCNTISKPSQIKLKSCSISSVLVKLCGGLLWTSRTGSSNLNAHIFVKLGKILHKSCGASNWESPKPKSWKLSSKRTISPELNP